MGEMRQGRHRRGERGMGAGEGGREKVVKKHEVGREE